MLSSDSVAGTRSVRSSLELIRDGMRTTPAPSAELAPIHKQTLELLDRNIARLGGTTPDGAIRGYSNHPDYAEVGRIRANMTLLEHARTTTTDVTTTATGSAADAASAPAAAATTSAETLAW